MTRIEKLASGSPKQTFVIIPALTLLAELLRGRAPRLRWEWRFPEPRRIAQGEFAWRTSGGSYS